MDSKANVAISGQGSSAVVTFQAAAICNVEDVADVSKQVKDFLETNRPKRMVFDFENVKFFSSQVLGLILEARAKLQAYDGEVVISAINPQLHRVFKITNLDKLFRFFPDKCAALAVDTN
jgi:anti-sigma B factor antagonist